jgi:primosomal protein N' (replication factor Y) (superfamily II helicase)
MPDSTPLDDLFDGALPPAHTVDVLVPVALDRAYSYRVPFDMRLAPGDVVSVPLGTRDTLAVVWDVSPDDAPSSGAHFKAVLAKHDMPPLPAKLRRFVDWVASYTLAPRGLVARMALRDPAEVAPERPRLGVRLSGQPLDRETPARMRVLAAAEGGFVLPKAELAKMAGVSTGVIDGLVDAGVLETTVIPAAPVALAPDPDHATVSLSADQRAAADDLVSAVAAKAYSVTLLEGVTGSGKTEVYFEAIAEAVRQGRQALVLIPEIALTTAFLQRFEDRFGVKPAQWHSGVAPTRKNRLWRAVAEGTAQVVVGARSALFLPFQNLGLIIIDEEHEQTYKQEDGVHYHARDMAVVRGRIEQAAVILASATPAVETQVNAASGRYAHVSLPSRHGGRKLPTLAAIDLRQHPPGHGRWISAPLRMAVEETMAAGHQALLFLNRRGYAPLTVCNACGHRWQCKQCSAWLVEHRFRRALVCHHCGYTERAPTRCESCGTENSLTVCGPGVERIAEEAAALFPGRRLITLSSDFPGGTDRLRRELEAIADGEFDIIIGTQLVAKGHNFPNLALVGVVDADVGLTSGDPRAAERTFQMLQQVTGRAGRGDTPGRGLIQTHDPSHPVMRAILSGDAKRFYAEEIRIREAATLPPFGRLAAMVVAGADKNAAEQHARDLARTGLKLLAAPDASAMRWEGIGLLGPAEAPLAMIRGRYRFRLLIKGPRQADVQGFLRTLQANGPKLRGGTRVGVDIDPVSFL